MIEILIQNEQLQLFPERAIFWKRRATLLLADTHWGKAAAIRSTGIPIPGGTTSADVERLSLLIGNTRAERIVLLGDAIHARAGRVAKTLQAVAEWRDRHPQVEMILVRGNHDVRAGDPPTELRIHCVNAPLIESPFVFQHFPAPSPGGYALAGHIHPAVRIGGRAGEGLKLPCFYFTPSYGILPAFGSLTGCGIVHPAQGDLVYAIADGDIVRIE
jgi:DNA ligase-associated metallophosphoesterase